MFYTYISIRENKKKCVKNSTRIQHRIKYISNGRAAISKINIQCCVHNKSCPAAAADITHRTRVIWNHMGSISNDMAILRKASVFLFHLLFHMFFHHAVWV